jgi:hypothetical protein
MKERLSLAAFVLSAAVLAYGLGFLTLYKGLWPVETLVEAVTTADDLTQHWKHEAGIEPSRLLVPAADPERQRLRIVDPDRMAVGNRFIAGFAPEQASSVGAVLLDAAGRELHRWSIDYAKLVPDAEDPDNVFLHGILPLSDGSVIVSFDNGDVMARIGPCGKEMWVTRGPFHHALSLSDQGTIWIWEYQAEDAPGTYLGPTGTVVNREQLVEVDAATGRRLRQISLEDDIVRKQALYGTFAIHTEENAEGIVYCCDHFHPNDAKALPAALAPAFPMFRAGDLLISLRSLNLIAVIDGATARVKWSRIGPWHRQHDPDFLADGTISVLNNNMGLGASQVMVVDPASGDVRVAFDGATRGNFYTWRRGRHQWLENGNILLTESEKGRIIEVDGNGDVVWEYNAIYDRDRNGLVSEALLLPVDYFAPAALDCPPS